ncbi:MAG: PD-(D/E)XK nuclease family protein [Isosphaeraceae bacterium]
MAPNPRARNRVRREIILRGIDPLPHRAWCWEDLLDDTYPANGPSRLSESAARALLVDRIDEARTEGRLTAIGTVAASAGFRRRMAAKIAAWTRQGRDETSPPGGLETSPIALAEWRLFLDYRAALRAIDAQDAEGAALLAARRLATNPPSWLQDLAWVVLAEPPDDQPAAASLIQVIGRRVDSVDVLLRYDEDRPELYPTAEERITALLGWDFEPAAVRPASRPAGLKGLGRGLFRPGTARPIDRTDGLTVLSAPEGEPMARRIAGQVRQWIDEGFRPEELAIVVSRHNEASREIARTLASWGIAASPPKPSKLAADPGVAALLLAMAIPAEDWDAVRLVRLLRNGQIRPRAGRGDADDPLRMAKAASAVRDLRIFRDRDRILEALHRQAHDDPDPTDPEDARRRVRIARARAAWPIVRGLADLLNAEARAGRWDEQAARLGRIADRLGIDRDRPAVDLLFGAIEDHGDALERLGGGDRIRSWIQFTQEIQALARDLDAPVATEPPSAVPIQAVEEVIGLKPRCVILADLVEGCFPDRAVVTLDPEPDAAYAREMARYLEALGLPSERLVLACPSSDAKGQEILPAGFLDESRRLFGEAAWQAATIGPSHADPAILGDRSDHPAEARVRAVALASLRREPEELARIGGDPSHRPALLGIADAIEMAHARWSEPTFGIHDGRLGDPVAVALSDDFAPGKPTFSASQIETLAACPFQFFLRYALRLDPIDPNDELDSDAAARGRRIHSVLEELHQVLRDEGVADVSGEVRRRLPEFIDRAIREDAREVGGPARGLGRIEEARLQREGRRYARQFDRYWQGSGGSARPSLCEFTFGKEPGQRAGTTEALRIGEGDEAVLFQGVIDRIDILDLPEGRFFRVIDYKSGAGPSKSDVERGLALQLPLYAMAAQRLAFEGRPAAPLDAGYWSLSRSGFSAAVEMGKLKDGRVSPVDRWEEFRPSVERYVVEMVGRLRSGDVPVSPRQADCQKTCDYRSCCRIGQVRLARKAWAEAPAPPDSGP